MRKKIILFIVLLFLIPSILFFITTKHSVSASLNFITKWGSYEPYSGGSGNGKFSYPLGVAIDTTGNIYVVDQGNNRVEVFDQGGNYVTQWGSFGSEEGQFDTPKGITTAVLSGITYVYVSDNNGVEKLKTDGTPVQRYGSGVFSEANGVAVDSLGNVYVADRNTDKIQEFNPDGSSKKDITGVSGPFDVAVDSLDNVYVADTNNNKVKEFTSDGTSVTEWDTVYPPFGIAVDNSSGDVYTFDKENNTVEHHKNSDGTITQWGSEGSGDGQFAIDWWRLGGIAVNGSGDVYVVDSINNRVEKFDSGGNYLSKLGYSLPSDGAFNTPQGIAVDSSGNVYIADTLNNRIQKFDNSGTYLAQWGTPGVADNQFANPFAIAIGPGSLGNIYVTDTDNNRIEQFDSGGTFIGTWGLVGGGNSQFNSPNGIAVDSSGNVYVVDTGNNRIQEFKSDGTYITQWGGAGSNAGKFNNPIAIAIDSAGNVYVTDAGNSRVQKFSSSGAYVSQWLIDSGITGISVNVTGNVYVADAANNEVKEFSNSGAFISSIGGSGTGNGQFNSPSGVAFDSSGNLFVVDTNNNRVQKFSVNLDLGIYFSSADTNFYRGDDTVYALINAGNTLYLGGNFGLEAVDLTTGQKMDWNPDIPNYPSTGDPVQVYSLAYSADNKMLYVGTSFGLWEYDTSTSAGTLVTDFSAMNGSEAGGSVYALKIIGNTLYVGGSFTQADSVHQRRNLGAFDISSSIPVLNSWEGQDGQGTDSNSASTVYAFTASNTELFVGGNFSTVEGVSQPAIAAFDLTSGNLVDSFISGFADTDTIKALAYDNNKIYAGGVFTLVNSYPFSNLVSLDEATGGAILAWVPTTQNGVNALAIEKNYLYVGEGNNGGSGGYGHGYNMQTGNSIDWYPDDSQPILSMLVADPALYVGLDMNRNTTLAKPNQVLAVKNNVNRFDIVPVAQAAEIGNLNGNLLADIGGLSGTIYLAKFDAIPSPTVTLAPTNTPTLTSSPSSPRAPVCSDQKPGIPSNPSVVAGPGAGQATLSWTAPTGTVTDYSIVYSNDLNVKKWGVVSTGNVTTYVISNLPLNQNYYFWINAVNGCMPGDPIDPELELLMNSTGSAALSGAAGASNNTFVATQTANSTLSLPSPLPASGPADTIKIGIAGIIITIIGGALLLAL